MDSLCMLFGFVPGLRARDTGVVQISGFIHQDACSRNGRYAGRGIGSSRIIVPEFRMVSQDQADRHNAAVLADKYNHDTPSGQSRIDPRRAANYRDKAEEGVSLWILLLPTTG